MKARNNKKLIRGKQDGIFLEKKRPHNKGLVDLLLACPVKGFFVRPEFPETTDTIKSPFE